MSIIAAGPILKNALVAAEELATEGVDVRVISMTSVKPIDKNIILECSALGPVVTVEEHSVIGGLGDSVASVLAEAGASCGFKKFGVEDRFMKIVGDQEYLRAHNGLSGERLAKELLVLYQRAHAQKPDSCDHLKSAGA